MSYSVRFEERWEALKGDCLCLYMHMQLAFSRWRTCNGPLALCKENTWFLGDWWRDFICLAWHALLQGHQSQARSTGHGRPAPLCQVTQVDIKPGPHLSKVLSKTCLWGPRSGHKTQVTVNTNIDGHVTIRVRAGCEGLSILWSEPFPRNFQEWKGLWARARRNSSYYQPNH